MNYADYYNQSNQRRRYNSGATIENGKTVRYVKLVFDDDDFRRFADILVGRFMSAIEAYENKPAVTEEPNERIVQQILADVTRKCPDESMHTLTKALLFNHCKKAADERQDPTPIPEEKHECVIEPVNASDEEDDDFAEKYADIPAKTESSPIVQNPFDDQRQDPNAWKTYLKPYENNMEKVTISVLIKNWRDFYMYTNEKIVEKFKQQGRMVTTAAVSHWATGATIPQKRYHYVIKELLNLSDIEFDNAYRNSVLIKTRNRFNTVDKE